ncbi:MAG: DUF4321 domain-containing protein [Defluviitaleaceae bacterium]|nr:DUF4321 domain-containing protein [Defluviitaleaceae bacterium]
MSWRTKNSAVLLLIMLAGLVVGFFLGELISDLTESVAALSFLGFLGYFRSFGIENIALDLIVVQFSFGIRLNLSLMGVVCMLLFMFLYIRRK